MEKQNQINNGIGADGRTSDQKKLENLQKQFDSLYFPLYPEHNLVEVLNRLTDNTEEFAFSIIAALDTLSTGEHCFSEDVENLSYLALLLKELKDSYELIRDILEDNQVMRYALKEEIKAIKKQQATA